MLSSIIRYYCTICYLVFAIYIFCNWGRLWSKRYTLIVLGFILCPIMVIYCAIEELTKLYLKGQ
jgi:hypothetical protein